MLFCRLLLATTCLLAAAEEGGTLIVDLNGDFPVRAPGLSLLSGAPPESLHEATLRLMRALGEPEPVVVLDVSDGFRPGLAGAEELAAVVRARKGDKRVIILLDNVEDDGSILAAACDEVVMADGGLLLIDGLSASNDYYAEALGRIGVRFHAVASGPEKTAPEPLTRSSPSPAAIAETTALLAGIDAALIELSGRAPGVITQARAQAPQTSTIAVATGLVDRAQEHGDFFLALTPPVRWLEDADTAPDLSSLPGMLDAVQHLLSNSADGPRPEQLVVIYELVGELVDEPTSEPGSTIGTDVVADLEDLAADDAVVAVVLRIDSPGGAAGCSDRLHHAVRRLAAVKPVVALCDGVCASGGYYVACATQHIIVHRTTIIGSIGVFALVADLDGARGLLGISHHTISTGPRAGLFDADTLTPEKEAALRQIVDDVDARFQGVVATTRQLAPERVAALADGKVYTGDQAIANGLADARGDLLSAVQEARQRAGIATPLPLERLPNDPGLLDLLSQGLLGGTHALAPELLRWARLATSGRPAIRVWQAVPKLR